MRAQRHAHYPLLHANVWVSQASEIVSAEAGAGLVKVTATAGGKLKSVQIDPSLFVPGKQKVVEDLTVSKYG